MNNFLCTTYSLICAKSHKAVMFQILSINQVVTPYPLLSGIIISSKMNQHTYD